MDSVSPLTDPDEIRLLCLQPGFYRNDIVCTTQHVKLSTIPQYEALSYVWGPERLKCITLNSHPYQIRENLASALIHLRHESEPRILWIDSICIKQDDVKERNHQVSRMGSIYSQATKVVAWMGLADEFTAEALGYLQDFEQAPEIISLTGFIFQNEFAGTEQGNRILEGVRSISLRPYWTRLWIIQELQLASDTDIQCGKDRVPWDVFKAFVIDLEFEDPEYPVVSAYHFQKWQDEERVNLMSNLIWQSSNMDKHSSAGTHRYLSMLCQQNRRAQCEKDVDKIFGLWALAPPCCQVAVPVDYGLSLYEVLGKIFDHDRITHDTPSKHEEDRDEGVRSLWRLLIAPNSFFEDQTEQERQTT